MVYCKSKVQRLANKYLWYKDEYEAVSSAFKVCHNLAVVEGRRQSVYSRWGRSLRRLGFHCGFEACRVLAMAVAKKDSDIEAAIWCLKEPND